MELLIVLGAFIVIAKVLSDLDRDQRHVDIINEQKNYKGDYVRNRSLFTDKWEHRAVAEKVLKRKLRSNEEVHHMNGRRDHNEPSNLCVMKKDLHSAWHMMLRDVKKETGSYPPMDIQREVIVEKFKGILLDKIS